MEHIILLMAVFSTVNMIICLPRRLSLPVTIIAFAVFTGAFMVANHFTGYMAVLMVSNSYIYIILVLVIFKAHVFQVLFSFFSQAFISLALTFLLIMVFDFLGLSGKIGYFAIVLVIIFACYIALMLRFGKPLMKKLFDGGSKVEWALYSISAFMAHTFLFLLLRVHEKNNLLHFGALVFLIWSFLILYYAIINTHDRTRKQFEANYAKEIIRSGGEHYQKMNELFEKLRIMRHDFKYHQNVLLDFMQKGETGRAIEYLKGQQTEALRHELMHFCDNHVINALLIWYAGRYEKSQVDYTFKVALIEKLPISDYDMCIVVGNLLENALEASLKLQDNRKVDLDIIIHNEQFALKIRNNVIQGQQRPTMDDPATIPANQSNGRGLGLRSVRIVTDRYNGKLFIKQVGNAFAVTVLIDLATSEPR